MTTKLVLVRWEDHHSNDLDDWVQPSSPDELKPIIIVTVGQLVCESDSMIEVVRDTCGDLDDKSVCSPLRILKKCIVEMRELG